MANNYEVSNILIKLESSSKSTVEAVNEAQKSLRNLKTTLNGIGNLDLKQVRGNLKSISTLDFGKLKSAFKPLQSIDLKQLSGFNRQMKNIANLNFDNVDFQKLEQQINTLTVIIDPFIQKIQQAEPSLKAFTNALDLGEVNAKLMVAEEKVKEINSRTQSRKVLDDVKIQKANVQLEKAQYQLEKIKNKSDKARISFSKLFNLGQLYFWLNYTKRVSNALTNMMTSAIDFNETLNKFQVSMGEYYDESVAFVNNLTYAFNLSTQSIMNYQSTFKNMLDALGNLGQGNTYQLSETLTRMAIDYASLFNVEITQAMEQFQGVLSGQIRSIRTVAGYDVSEASIFGIYQQLGGTKTMRQLDQVEKRLLRIIALQQQMEKTGAVGDFEKTLNSTANMLKQLSETFKEIGRWIGQLTMVYLEPFIEKVLAGAVALREMLKALNIAQGYKYEDFGTGGLFGAIEESANGANEAVENLKTNLLGFDTLNILGDNSTSAITPDYGMLLNQIKSYSSSLTEVTNKANQMSESILTWLGYTKQVNQETGNISWLLGEGYTNIEIIRDVVVGLISFVTTNAIFSKIKGLTTTISTIGTLLSGISLPVTAIVAGIALIVTGFLNMYNSNEEFKKSIDGTLSNIIGNIKQIWSFLSEKIYPKIKPALDVIWNIISEISSLIVDYILKKIEFITKILTGDFSGAWQVVLNFIGDIDKSLERIFGEENWNAFKEKIKNIFTSIKEWFKNSWFADMIGWFKSLFSELGKIFEEYILPLLKGVAEKVFTVFSNLWTEKIKPVLDIIGNGIKNTFEGVKKGLSILWEGLTKEFKTIINLLISGINLLIKGVNKISFDFPDWIPGIGGKTFGINIPEIPMLANGAVIDKPTVAMMGEYAGAKTNKEIVTPENLMRQVFVESMLPIAQIIANGNNDVVSAIEDMANRPIHLNGRKVSENIFDDMNKVAIRKTGRALSYAR